MKSTTSGSRTSAGWPPHHTLSTEPYAGEGSEGAGGPGAEAAAAKMLSGSKAGTGQADGPDQSQLLVYG